MKENKPCLLLLNDIHISKDNIPAFQANWQEAMGICRERDIREVVVGGDLFFSRAAQTLDVLLAVRDMLVSAADHDIHVTLAEGNHDKVNQESLRGYCHVFDRHPNVTVVDEYLTLCRPEWKFALHVMSYFPEDGSFAERLGRLAAEALSGEPEHFLYIHEGINGALAQPSEKELPARIFSPFDKVFVGHYHNRADNNNTFSGLVNWNYGLHYQFRLTENFKLLAGGLFDVNGGFVYNLRNSNNPASARAYVNLDASGMAIWHLKIKRYPMVLRYQVNVPMIGLMFSPHYGQSYYEIFSLGNSSGVIQFTSLHNQPSLRQMLSVDLPIGYTKMRFSYLADLQQSNVNGIKTHTYSHVFMVGFVKDLYRVSNKKGANLPPSVRAY